MPRYSLFKIYNSFEHYKKHQCITELDVTCDYQLFSVNRDHKEKNKRRFTNNYSVLKKVS